MTNKKDRFPMSAKTSFGFEDLLVEELGKVGAINLKQQLIDL